MATGATSAGWPLGRKSCGSGAPSARASALQTRRTGLSPLTRSALPARSAGNISGSSAPIIESISRAGPSSPAARMGARSTAPSASLGSSAGSGFCVSASCTAFSASSAMASPTSAEAAQ